MKVLMTEKELKNHNASAQQAPKNVPSSVRKKSSRALWLISLVFFAFVITVFLTQHEDTIDWIEDYDAGIRLAKQQNKPILLAFYKKFAGFTEDTMRYTYTDPKVIEYVEAGFVPILIDVLEQPEIAERYSINYYPTHYIKHPDSDEVFGPLLGYDPPALFIKKLENLFKEMNAPDE